MLLNRVTDGLHQVRLTQPDAAIKEERIVVLGRGLGHSQRCRTGELVAGAHDERLECVARI